jgi:hypothetical protein
MPAARLHGRFCWRNTRRRVVEHGIFVRRAFCQDAEPAATYRGTSDWIAASIPPTLSARRCSSTQVVRCLTVSSASTTTSRKHGTILVSALGRADLRAGHGLAALCGVWGEPPLSFADNPIGWAIKMIDGTWRPTGCLPGISFRRRGPWPMSSSASGPRVDAWTCRC